MSGRERRASQAAAVFWRDVAAAGIELRTARLSAGLTMEAVGRAAGVSRSTVLRTERGRPPGPRPDVLARHASAVGLRARLRLYPDGSPLRDAGQVDLMRRLRVRVGSAARWATEVPIPLERDPRAIDAVLTYPEWRCGIEFIVRLYDCQGQLRPIHLKQRDAGLQRMVVVVRATHANRRAVRAAGSYLAEAFPLGTRATLAALEAGRDPGVNGLVLL